jgi:LysW-gamma-L-alpha-aminoadipyl-6-phosphate/LysW-L-glutamyl-5-phosphate reductase
MAIRAAIIGATGFGGGELLRWLVNHPSVEGILPLSRKGANPVADVHPHLRGIGPSHFAPAMDWEWLEAADQPVIFAAMPHGEFARQYVDLVDTMGPELAARVLVIDLSADFRLPDSAHFFAQYGHDHPCPDRLGEWTYGLPELSRVSSPLGEEGNFPTPCPLPTSGEGVPSNPKVLRIANPGCFATAIQLGILPFRTLNAAPDLFVTAATGSSGSGATPGEGTHHPTRAHDMRAYKVLSHQHQAEMAAHGAAGFNLRFVPVSAPMVRGIFAVIQGSFERDLRRAFEATYAGDPFVQVIEGQPKLAAVLGGNFVHIGIEQVDDRFAITVALDNLGKGMATQAIQNMNLALGLPETSGLQVAGAYP